MQHNYHILTNPLTKKHSNGEIRFIVPFLLVACCISLVVVSAMPSPKKKEDSAELNASCEGKQCAEQDDDSTKPGSRSPSSSSTKTDSTKPGSVSTSAKNPTGSVDPKETAAEGKPAGGSAGTPAAVAPASATQPAAESKGITTADSKPATAAAVDPKSAEKKATPVAATVEKAAKNEPIAAIVAVESEPVSATAVKAAKSESIEAAGAAVPKASVSEPAKKDAAPVVV